jgi:coenzyme F420 hydrogenase subunit beta
MGKNTETLMYLRGNVSMNKSRTIEDVVKSDLCNGCGTCVSLCPHGAIKLVLNKKRGLYSPSVESTKCEHCGVCFKVCPGHHVPFNKLNLEIFDKVPRNLLMGCYLNCYAGFSSDPWVRFNSASGGLVTSLLISALDSGIIDGALVTRMRKDKALEPEPFVARSKEEVIEAARSKYCPVPANIALKQILENEGRYAVVGLPCHIHGIRKAEEYNKKLKERIVLHIGLFCAKTISFNGTVFLIKRLRLTPRDISSIQYRGNGWPGNMALELNSKTQIKLPLHTYYDNKFAAFAPWRCNLCIDQTAELADISFGDAWLSEFKSTDKLGTSLVISRNKLGEEILGQETERKNIKIAPVDIEKVIESQGGFYAKKNCNLAYIKLSKLIGKRRPVYDAALNSCYLKYYVAAIMGLVKNMLAANRNTWWLLEAYCSFGVNIGKLLNDIKQLLLIIISLGKKSEVV